MYRGFLYACACLYTLFGGLRGTATWFVRLEHRVYIVWVSTFAWYNKGGHTRKRCSGFELLFDFRGLFLVQFELSLFHSKLRRLLLPTTFTMSIRAFPPPVLDAILAQQPPAFGPPYSFSRSFAANPAKVNYVTSLYREDTFAEVRRLALANYDNVFQFLFVFESMVYVFTHPTVQTNNINRPIMIGTLTDAVWSSVPASIRLPSYVGWTTSLIPAAAVDLYNLPRGALLPDTIQGATTPAGVNEPGSFARLDFGPDAPTILPTIAAVPVMLAVPVGVHLPTGPWSLNDPQPELEAVYPFFEVWRSAHLYLAKNNAGSSVTMGGPLFDQAAFVGVNQFPDTFPLRKTSDTTFLMIPLNSPHFSDVADMVTMISQAAMVRVVAAWALLRRRLCRLHMKSLTSKPKPLLRPSSVASTKRIVCSISWRT